MAIRSRCGSVPVMAKDLSVRFARGHGAPDLGRAGAPALGPAGGGAPLPTVSRRHRQRPAPCRGARRDLARTDRLAARRVQAGRTRSLDRLAGGAAVPAPASDRQQLALCHPDAWPGAQLGLAGAGAEPAAAVAAGHPHRRWPMAIPSRFWRRRSWMSRALSGPATARRTVAGADPRLCPRARRLRRAANAKRATPWKSSCSN